MPQTSLRQRKTIGRVMHEFKHGELASGRGGRGGKVKSPQQAVAIALREAGASKYESPEENRESFQRTKEKEARGETAQQETEGKSRVGAKGRRESSASMGGENATELVRPRRKKSAARKTGARRKTGTRKSAGRKAGGRRKSAGKAARGRTGARKTAAKRGRKAGRKRASR